jgi:uncharacterized membrane protein YgdD (TMEM256/DUF423 family)
VRQSVSNPCIIAVILAGGGAVLLGAFGAHALKGVLDAGQAGIWETAVRFQFWHALALALVVSRMPCGRAGPVAAWAFSVGIVLFCGSLYALALGSPHWVGVITPFGGLAFVFGWIALGLSLRHRAVNGE